VLLWLSAIAVGGYGALLGALFLVQRRLLFRPGPGRPELGDLGLLGVCEVVVRTRDGLALASWYRPPPPGRPVVLYFHGNGGHIGYRAERLRRFTDAGLGVLLLEYRGYGGNPGSPTEHGLYADAEAASEFLVRQEIAPDRLVLWGESLGAAVAVDLAGRRGAAAVVLEAPFTSIAAVAQLHYPYVPAAMLMRDRFDALSRIGRIKSPLLVMHGGRDRVVPIRFGRAVLEAAPSPKEGWFEPRAEHEDLAAFGALEAAVAFIERRTRNVHPGGRPPGHGPAAEGRVAAG
jgi:fermentation-respiration switch protein FrsA (DUF1100 family)